MAIHVVDKMRSPPPTSGNYDDAFRLNKRDTLLLLEGGELSPSGFEARGLVAKAS